MATHLRLAKVLSTGWCALGWMVRRITSIQIDPDLWKYVKTHCRTEGCEIATFLERLVARDLGVPIRADQRAISTRHAAGARVQRLVAAYKRLEEHGPVPVQGRATHSSLRRTSRGDSTRLMRPVLCRVF